MIPLSETWEDRGLLKIRKAWNKFMESFRGWEDT